MLYTPESKICRNFFGFHGRRLTTRPTRAFQWENCFLFLLSIEERKQAQFNISSHIKGCIGTIMDKQALRRSGGNTMLRQSLENGKQTVLRGIKYKFNLLEKVCSYCSSLLDSVLQLNTQELVSYNVKVGRPLSSLDSSEVFGYLSLVGNDVIGRAS